MKKFVASLAILALCSFVTRTASADPDPSQAQDWTVDGFDYFAKGLLTPILLNTYVAKGHDTASTAPQVQSNELTRTSFRLFYGLTDHINFFGQLNMAKPDGEGVDYEGFEMGLHIKFFEWQNRLGKFQLGLAWENEVQRAPKYVDTPYDMDFHPMIEQDIRKVSLLFNPIFEKDLTGDGHWEGSYTAQTLYHFSHEVSAGLEFYGDLAAFKSMPTTHELGDYVMPVVNWKCFSIGVGIGVTAGADRLVTKLNMSLPIKLPWAL